MPKQKKSNSKSSNTSRDNWLAGIANAMTSWFDELGFPTPAFEVRTGFPSSGRRSSNVTESWSDDNGDSYIIFVRPDCSDEMLVAAGLAFQLCRISVGRKDSHGHLFRHLATSIGLKGTKTESPPGLLFKEIAKPLIAKSGPLPGPAIAPKLKNAGTRQTTRLLKVSCKNCGYVARVSRKWLDEVGPPKCPLHGAMQICD